MKKLTKKTYLLLLALSVTVCSLAYLCICMFLPYINSSNSGKCLASESEALVSQLMVTEKSDSESLFTDFIRATGAEVSLLDNKYQSVSMFTFKYTGVPPVKGTEYPFRFADSDSEYVLIVSPDMQRRDEIQHAVILSIPFVTCIILLLSLITAWIFSRYTTRPILRINNIAGKMAALDFSWYCPDVRDDEIGMLSKSINELSDKLHEALDSLDQKNHLLEDEISIEKERERRRMLFFSGVSHELKTPVAIVIGQLEGMQAHIGVYKDTDKYLARSSEILQSLNSFIREVLFVSHLDMSDDQILLPFDISEMLLSVIDDCRDITDTSLVSVSENIETGLLVCADEMLLKKAFSNIVSNAVIHTPEHGRVSIKLYKENNNIRLRVVNSPAHISEEHLPHIFEAFYRVNQETKHGSGLGLYITRMIFETYHIDYSVTNTSDGVEFCVFLQEASV
ncbi:MAG: HAMP domain-containing sensor histidine kinase [Oscillospiraceae bacterium]|nr:HAMP domain-containing sensor histidine kinase [Oscillospiraceae bacterium]